MATNDNEWPFLQRVYDGEIDVSVFGFGTAVSMRSSAMR